MRLLLRTHLVLRSVAAPPTLAFAQSRRRAAFTLVEILIVLVVAATLLAIAAPTASKALEVTKANALAREIAADVRYAQVLAVKTGDRHRVSFWSEGQAYAVRRDNGGRWDLCTHPITKKEWRIALGDKTRYAGLTMGKSQFGAAAYLYWDKFGAPESGGTVTFTLGDISRTIRVAPLSGKVTVE
jgi:prepilin-type N-terminal cleavage/methylation domain-containing protein